MTLGKAILRWLIAIIALLAIVIVIMLTPFGLRLGMRLATKIVPGHLQYERISGILTGPIEIKGFEYDHDGTRISMQHFKMNWRPLALLWGKLEITELRANRVYLTLGSSSNKKTTHTTGLPFVIQIKRANLRNVAIGTKPNQYPFFLDHMHLKSIIVPNKISVDAYARISKPFPARTRLHAIGNFSKYTITLRVKSRHLNWVVYGTGNAESVKLHTRKSQTLDGSLSATADVRWAPTLQWDIDLNARELNFNNLKTGWPRALSIQLNTQGKIVNKAPLFSVKALITTPQAKINITATQDPGLKLQWNAAINQLSSLIPGSQGSLNTKGSWAGTIKHPITKGSVNANALSLFGFNVKKLQGQWDISPNVGKISGQVGIKNVNIAFDTQGRLTGAQWRGKFKKLNINSSQYANWRLSKPSDITLSSTQIIIPELCLRSTSKSTGLCLKGAWNRDKAWQFTAKGQRVNPGLLTGLFLPRLSLYGKTSVDATINGIAGKLQNASAKVTINKGRFRYRFNGNYIASRFQRSSMLFNFDKTGLRSQVGMFISKNNTINVSFSLPHVQNLPEKQTIQGNIRADMTNLSLLDNLMPDVINPRGRLKANLTISGTTANPNITGNLSFQKGSVALERLGITLTNIDAQISATQNVLNYSVNVSSKGKPIHIKGKSHWTTKGLESDVSIQGNNVLVMNTPEYVIYASPNLQISVLKKTLHMKGSITIPKGLIQPHTATNTVNLPYGQIIYVAGKPTQRVPQWQIFANVKVILGNDVTVKTAGLNATINGSATLIGHPKRPTIANGRINITKGTFTAYGKTLTLQPGSYIQFVNSPASNPSVNIRATKTIAINTGASGQQIGVNDLIVGVSLTGTFRHPKIKLFSVPGTLSQADILSYLILGYATNLNTGGNLDLLLEAATALKLGGDGSGIGGAISQIKQGLGLSELGVESETLVDALGNPIDQQTAFVIGKHLTQRIYIRYSVGLGQGPFAPVNIFQIRYLFGRNWAIQTDSSSQDNGIDILYSIER